VGNHGNKAEELLVTMAAIAMPLEWNFWYPLWMIQDGLPNRSVGDQFSWQIEFDCLEKLSISEERRKTIVPLADYEYQIIGEVTAVYRTTSLSEKSCVVDIGLKVIGNPDSLPVRTKLGDYVCGKISLSLSHGTGIRPGESEESLKRKWQVKAIQADTTPYITLPDKPNYSVRDNSRVCYKPVWSTADIQAENYVLHCFEVL
jgi:hypothetical protein